MKKHVLVLALAALLAPSLALASWWNPMTWFKKTPTAPVVLPEAISVNQEPNNSPAQATLDISSWATYTDKIYKIFSLQYPNTWAQTQEATTIYFSEEGSSQPVMSVSFGNGTENQIAKASENFLTENVKLGSNMFTKITVSENPLTPDIFSYYILLLGGSGESSFHLAVQTQNPSAKESVQSILSSIKIDTEQVAAVLKRQEATRKIIKITSMVENFRGIASSYNETNAGYAKICSPENGSSIDMAFKNLLTLVSSTDIFCNSSNDAYVFYVRNSSKEIVCVDSAGKLLVSPNLPKSLACE